MIDVNFSELLVIAVVALVVVGPERLPKVARTLGLLFGRVQRYVSEVKSDINRELKLEELRKVEADLRESARTMEHTMTDEVNRAEQGLKAAAESIEAQVPFAPPALQPEPSVPVAPASSIIEAQVALPQPALHAEPAAPATPVSTQLEQPEPSVSAAPVSPQLELGLEMPPTKPEKAA